jgi:hypothetical protein
LYFFLDKKGQQIFSFKKTGKTVLGAVFCAVFLDCFSKNFSWKGHMLRPKFSGKNRNKLGCFQKHIGVGPEKTAVS